ARGAAPRDRARGGASHVAQAAGEPTASNGASAWFPSTRADPTEHDLISTLWIGLSRKRVGWKAMPTCSFLGQLRLRIERGSGVPEIPRRPRPAGRDRRLA